MITGIQTPDVVHNIEQLQTADASIELPSIDPSALTPTFGLEPGWVRRGDISWNTAAVSINGANPTITDTDVTGVTILRFDALQQRRITVERQRMWNYIDISLGGGTVSPILINVFLDLPLLQSVFLGQFSGTNPGRIMIGPIYVPIGWTFNIRNNTAGGGGDTIQVSAMGVQALSGVPLPLQPSIGVINTPFF
jgi:hypothetical protein